MLGGAPGAVFLASCDRANPLAIVSFDPATGQRRWRTDLSAAEVGDDTGTSKWLVSADPVVVAIPTFDNPGSTWCWGTTVR